MPLVFVLLFVVILLEIGSYKIGFGASFTENFLVFFFFFLTSNIQAVLFKQFFFNHCVHGSISELKYVPLVQKESDFSALFKR